MCLIEKKMLLFSSYCLSLHVFSEFTSLSCNTELGFSYPYKRLSDKKHMI